MNCGQRGTKYRKKCLLPETSAMGVRSFGTDTNNQGRLQMSKKITAAVLALSFVATGALAKGHDQGNTEMPGTTVGATVAASQSLGAIKGNRPDERGPDNGAALVAGR
jgi:hypothetical protein